VGYSPERVNPGDKEHTIDKVVKVVAGDTEKTAELLERIYGSITKVFRARNIKTAEAAKVIENIQRDLNIALMNELALIFHKLGLDTKEVLETASTKWNFLRFEPGLVVGHCIPVDPYYLAYKSFELGYVPELILAGRSINEYMAIYVSNQVVKQLIKVGKQVKGSKVLVLGITFKENVPDVRNSKVVDMIKELIDCDISVFVYDPLARKEEVKSEYGIELIEDYKVFAPYDAIILAVRHRIFLDFFNLKTLLSLSSNPPILFDIKGIFDKEEVLSKGFVYWRL
jgi:UDP-N-acetyl-D-galactosamine dehydrogenase